MTTVAPPAPGEHTVEQLAEQLAELRTLVTQTKDAVEQLAAAGPVAQLASGWLTPQQIHEATGKSLPRIREALQSGELHGHQTVFRGRWTVHSEAVKAWLAELSPAVQMERCACKPPTPAPRGRRSTR